MSSWPYVYLSFFLVFSFLPELWAQEIIRPAALESASQTSKPRTLSLDFVDADLHDVLRILAEEGNFNLVVTGDVQGQVTLRFNAVTWDQAFDTIILAHGLAVRHQENIVFVGNSERD